MALDSKVAIDVQIKNVQKITDLKNSLKALRKEQRDIEKATKEGNKSQSVSSKRYKDNAKAIDSQSKSLRGLNRSQKDATKSSGSLTKSFIKGAAAVGIVIGAFRAVSRMVSSVVSTFTEFEFVMAKVNAVSGATEKEFAGLTKTAEELGRTTFFTATQVGELMLNYSKLGFTAQEIQNAVEPTLSLATATGSDLARAATVAGAAVRGFGLDASETERVVDVMAVSFSSSAMNIEKWQTSMTKVAPIAKSAGFSIEDTAAIMSKLTDSGIEASIAGTSLRNILLKMQDPTSDLTKAFGKTIHGLDDLVPAMKKFVEQGGSMADVMEVVDLRQAAAFEQMITSADSTLELRNALLDATGEGKRMADMVGDTLQGAFLKFSSALQGFSIAFMNNFSDSMQKGVESAARFFNEITQSAEGIAKFVKALITVAKFLGIYKTVLIATNATIVAYEIATGTATVATKRFIVAFRTLTATMMANPYVAVGALLISLAMDLFNLRHEVNETDESWEKMNKTIRGDSEAHRVREEIIQNLKGELASVQDLQRGKTALLRLEAEIIAREKDYAHRRATLRENANAMFREDEEGLKDAYVDRGMRDAEQIVTLKKLQHFQLQGAIAIATKTVKVKEGTKAITANTKATKENALAQSFIADVTRDYYVALMNDVVNGTLTMAKAEQDLFDFKVELMENLLLDESLTYDERMKLEEMLIKLKLKNAKEEEDIDKKRLKSIKKEIKNYSDLGSALQTVAGDNESLNGIKEAGVAITRAAAVAESILNIQKAITAMTEGQLTVSTLLGTKATIANTAAKATQTGVEVASLAPKATAAILNQGAGDPFSAFFRIIAMIAIISKVMGMWEKGGIIPDEKKFAGGGMVHGKSHAQGGEKFNVGGRVAELEGGEAVINKRSTAMFRNQLSEMNQAGGGVKFADGGLMSSPAFTEAQFNANNQNQMLNAMGGQQKVVVVEADITDSQSTVSVIQANASF